MKLPVLSRLVATLGRLLPALMPSWRFFDAIGPSPRVDYAWVGDDGAVGAWHAFRPRPARVSFPRMLLRLLWNPQWNESLFVTRVAERLLEGETALPLRELPWRLQLAYRRGELGPADARRLCYRVRMIQREDERIIDETVYEAPAFSIDIDLR